MSVANAVPVGISESSLVQPKQLKLLGAFVWGEGVITSVSAQLADCFVFIEDREGNEHHRFVADLGKNEIVFPNEPQPFVQNNRRISYGLWAEMYDLTPRVVATALQHRVAA